MKDNIIQNKTMDFAIRIVKLYKHLQKEKCEFVLSKQLLRSGTSVGANVHEAICAQSKKDFLAKMYIGFKETSETEYWLNLLNKTDYLTSEEFDSIIYDCLEVKKILISIIKSSKGESENKS